MSQLRRCQLLLESVVVWSACLFRRHGRGTMRMIIKKFLPALAALALLGVLMSAAATVRAAGNDIQLSGTLTREDFTSLTRQLGFAASYFPLAPPAPLGILGLDAAVEATSVKLAKNSSFWQRAVG